MPIHNRFSVQGWLEASGLSKLPLSVHVNSPGVETGDSVTSDCPLSDELSDT